MNCFSLERKNSYLSKLSILCEGVYIRILEDWQVIFGMENRPGFLLIFD